MGTQLPQTEARVEKAVADFAKLCGCPSYPPHDSRRSESGFLDRVFARPPRLLFAEFKTERGRVSSDQRRWLELLALVAEANPHVEVHLWRPSNWGEIQAALR